MPTISKRVTVAKPRSKADSISARASTASATSSTAAIQAPKNALATPRATSRKRAGPTASLAERLHAVEQAVAQLRQRSVHVPSPAISARTPALPPKFWALNHLQASAPEQGSLVFAGLVTLPAGETYAWQREAQTTDLLAADWTNTHARLSALAHPVRLTILKALIDGKRDTQSLQALPDMGTTGQLYHHLKELENAGWIRQPRRGEYNVLAERVVPLLVILSACEIADHPKFT